MENEKIDLKYVIDQINKELNISTVARNELGNPASENKNAKWNMVYKSIYKEEKTPSFKISTKLNRFFCFATKNSGDVVKLYRDCKSLKGIPISIEEACKGLIKDYSLDIKLNNLPRKTRNKKFNDMEKKIIKFFQEIVEDSHFNLKSGHYENEHNYLTKERNISEETIDIFNLGYFDTHHNKFIDNMIKNIRGLTKDDLKRYGILNEAGNFSLTNRIIIPKYDVNGEVVSLCGRDLKNDDVIKYLRLRNNDDYAKECPELDSTKYLYNFDKAKNYIIAESEVILVEGYFDVMRLWEKGIYNVVALETTSMTAGQEKQLESIGPIKITSFLDADESGKKQQLNLLEKLSSKKKGKQFFYKKTFFVNDQKYDDFGKDPDEYLQKLDRDEVNELLQNKMNYRNYLIETYIERFEKDTSYSFKELFDDIGYLLNHYNSTYNEEIEKICRNEKGEDLDDFYERVEYRDDIEKLYLMRYLDAEDFYCENLIKTARNFTKNYKIYHDFMIDVLERMQSIYSGRDDKEVNIYDAAENKNQRTYGDRRSKIIVDVSDEFNRYISIELDYYENYLVVLNRLNDEVDSEKNDDINFFSHRVFEKIDDKKNQDKVKEYLSEAFEG